ncbi:DMT family transporter [Fangia hongkongensis]|uniref:DMT family transporter n=1 Tax=Fangia hongkongensis TaxID=270495 RepID=UPI000367C05B|nr:DMT family transporter [Fangia hongkongensis]MBK2124212.1 DMT family transporter [Fangia hongkongensis]
MTQKPKQPKALYAISLLILLGALWGSGYTIARYCMTHGVHPLGYGFWQSLGPMIFLLLVIIFARIPFSLKPNYIRYYIACGVLGIAIPNTVMYFAAAHIPSGILTVLINTVPILIFPLSILFALEHFSLKRFFVVLLGFLGILLTILSNLTLPTLHNIPWSIIALIAPLSFALCAVWIAAFRPMPSNSLSLSLGMLIISSLCLVPLTLIMGAFHPISFPLQINDWLIILEIILSSLGYIVLFVLIKLAGPIYYSLVGGMASVFGLLWGKLFYGESLNSSSWLGVFCIIGAIILLTLLLKKEKEVAEN